MTRLRLAPLFALCAAVALAQDAPKPPLAKKAPERLKLHAQEDKARAYPDDMQVVRELYDLQRQQEEYCKVNYEQAKARGDDNADLAKGPAGPCKGSIFSAIKQWNSAPDDDSQ